MAIAPGFEVSAGFDDGSDAMKSLGIVMRVCDNWDKIAKAVEPKMVPVIRAELAVSYGNSGLGVLSGRLYKALVSLSTIKINEYGVTAYVAKDQNAENDRVYHQFGAIVSGAVYGVGTGRKRSSSLIKSRAKIKRAAGGKLDMYQSAHGSGITVRAPWKGGNPFEFNTDQAERIAEIYIAMINEEIAKVK